jgi:hypothetical protein
MHRIGQIICHSESAVIPNRSEAPVSNLLFLLFSQAKAGGPTQRAFRCVGINIVGINFAGGITA